MTGPSLGSGQPDTSPHQVNTHPCLAALDGGPGQSSGSRHGLGGLSEVGPSTSFCLKEINISIFLTLTLRFLGAAGVRGMKRQPTSGHGVVYTCSCCVCTDVCLWQKCLDVNPLPHGLGFIPISDPLRSVTRRSGPVHHQARSVARTRWNRKAVKL